MKEIAVKNNFLNIQYITSKNDGRIYMSVTQTVENFYKIFYINSRITNHKYMIQGGAYI